MVDTDTSLHVRVNKDLKNEAAQILNDYGLSMSEAVCMFLNRVVSCRAFPLEMKIPNAETRAAMAETEKMIEEYTERFESEEEVPNATTCKALRDLREGKNVKHFKTAEEALRSLGI